MRAILVAILGVIMSLAAASATEPSGTSAVIPLPPATVRAKLLEAVPLLTFEHTVSQLPEAKLGGKLAASYAEDKPEGRFRFTPGGFAGNAPLSLGYHEKVADAALRRWIALPDGARDSDLVLSIRSPNGWRNHPGWKAEGYSEPYYSDYILHFAPAPQGTALEVIGYNARVLDGKRWSFAAQDGGPSLPHREPNWKSIVPVPSDVQETLTQLERAITGKRP